MSSEISSNKIKVRRVHSTKHSTDDFCGVNDVREF